MSASEAGPPPSLGGPGDIELSTVKANDAGAGAAAAASAAPGGVGDTGKSKTHALSQVRHGLSPWHARYWQQLVALMRKNWVLSKRNWKSTVIQLLAPLIFVVLMAIIDVAITSSAAENRSPLAFFTMGAPDDSEGPGAIPPCRVFDTAEGRYGNGGVIPGAWCASVAYVPAGNDEADDVMSHLATRRGWVASADPHDPATSLADSTADVVGFASEADLRAFMLQFPGRVGAAVLFNATDADVLPEDVRYEVWYNNTVVGRWLGRNAGLDPVWSRTNYGSLSSRVQRSVDEALVAARTGVDGASIEVSYRQYPEVLAQSVGAGIAVSMFGPLFLFCAIMFSFVIVLQSVVGEKEQRLVSAMRNVGLFESVYWLSWALLYLLIYTVSAILMIIGGIAAGLDFFVNTDFMVLLSVFVIYGMANVGFAFTLAAVIPRVKIANFVGLALFALGFILQSINTSSLSYVFFDSYLFSSDATNALMLYPPIGFAKIFADIDQTTRSSTEWDYDARREVLLPGGSYTWGHLFNGTYAVTDIFSLTGDGVYRVPPTADTLEFMILVFAIFSLCAWYLAQVFPGESGRAQMPWFVLDPRYWGVRCGAAGGAGGKRAVDGEDHVAIEVRSLVKKFGKFTAVNGLSVEMKRGQVFCLLGVNGAGKTTAISCMTGLKNPTGGDVLVEGYSVNSRVDAVRQLLGVCPQHDVLWNALTAEETLDFFARFKGVDAASRHAQVSEALTQVQLAYVRDKQAGTFSGGMKRRLSVAIAMMGLPSVVVLDEPTTGMDPLNRRKVWDMIAAVKKGRLVLLTTHSMEEAEALGDEIAIMAKGKIVAQGTSLDLKHKYGSGYQLSLVLSDVQHTAAMKERVASLLPGAQCVDDSAGTLTYGVGRKHVAGIPVFFKWVESLDLGAEGCMLKDIGIAHTTLEEVFITLARKGADAAEAEAAEGGGDGDVNGSAGAAALQGAGKGAAAGQANGGATLAVQSSSRLFQRALSNPTLPVPGQDGAAVAVNMSAGDGKGSLKAWADQGDRAPWEHEPGAPMLDKRPDVPAVRQMRALYSKLGSTQRKQTRANFCLVGCPVILLLVVFLLQEFVIAPIKESQAERLVQDELESQQFCAECEVRMREDCDNSQGHCGEWNADEEQCQDEYCDELMADQEAVFNWCWECREYHSRFGDNVVEAEVVWTRRMPGQWVIGDSSRSDGTWATSILVSSSDGAVTSGSAVTGAGAGVGPATLGSTPAGVVEVGGVQLSQWTMSGEVFNDTRYDELQTKAEAAGTGLVAKIPPQLTQYWPPWVEGQNNEPSFIAFPAFENVGTPAAVDARLWSAQESVRTMATFSFGDRDAYKVVNQLFPVAGADFSALDTTTARLRYSISWFFDSSATYDQSFPFASVRMKSCLAAMEDGTLDLSLPVFDNWRQMTQGQNDNSNGGSGNGGSNGGSNGGGGNGGSGNGGDNEREQSVPSNPCEAIGQGANMDDFSDNGDDEQEQRTDVVRSAATDEASYWTSGANTAEATVVNSIMAGVTTAFLRDAVGDEQRVTVGIRPMPYKAEQQTFDPEVILNNILNILVPLGSSFLIPTFLYAVVSEKELRLRSMMLSFGLKLRYYVGVMWSFDMALMLVQMTVFFVFGYIFSIRFFTRSSAGLFALLFFLWALASVSFSFFMSVFFNKSRPAMIVANLLILISIILNQVLSLAVWTTEPAPLLYLLWAPGCYFRGIYLFSQRSYVSDDLTASDELITVFWFLLLDAVLYMVAFLYLDQVMPRDFGVRRSPLFCFQDAIALARGDRARPHKAFVPETAAAMDSDVANEFRRVANGDYDKKAPVQVFNLVKEYGGGGTGRKVAVDNVSFVMPAGETLGLLGPNGAGKTSLVSVLTGTYPPTKGTAKLVGQDIRTSMKDIEQHLGITPQHDIVWPALSVRAHLLFYARLKGIDSAKEEEVIRRAAVAVELGEWMDHPAGKLSGGMMRRLSIAMALVGDPAVLMLDEPTTGLDPETVRHLWGVIERARHGRVTCVTTHNMLEADALSTRIAIMAAGSMRCIGSSLHLKHRFGSGFKIEVTFSPHERLPAVTAFITSVVPSAKLVESYMGVATFGVPREDMKVSTLFETMLNRPPELGIVNFGLRQTSLAEVFLRIASEAEAAGAVPID